MDRLGELQQAFGGLMDGTVTIEEFFAVQERLGYRVEPPPPWAWTRVPTRHEMFAMGLATGLPPEELPFEAPPEPRVTPPEEEPPQRLAEVFYLEDERPCRVQPLDTWKRQIRRRRETQAIREMSGW